MKKLLLLTTALVVVSSSAFAADLASRMYTKAPAPMGPPLYAWTGFYIGGHIGGAFRDGNNNGFGGNNNDGRFLAGGQVGADYQFSGSWVAGIEGQYSYVDRNGGNTFAFPGGTFGNNLRGLASATGRLGYTWGPGLLYVKGGYAYADTRNNGTGIFNFRNSRDGYTVGGGVEYMFAQSFSAKLEYMYYEFRNNQLFVGAPLVAFGNFRNEEHTIKLGVNYRFDLASPLTPRY